MGCTNGKPTRVANLSEKEPPRSKWIETTEKNFAPDGTLEFDKNKDFLELRRLLEEPLGQKYLGIFAKRIVTHEQLFAWVEIQEYKTIPTPDYRRAIAKSIFTKYIRRGALMELGGLTDQMRDHIEECLRDKARVTPTMFNQIHHMVFREMVQNTYKRFVAAEEFRQYKRERSETYNKVRVSDFDFLEQLGQGGFGRVVHALKLSTGRHYAMKIQLKQGLLHEHQSDLSQIQLEKKILAECSFPFVVDLHYALQTPQHAILVLGLCRAGDLKDALLKSKKARLSEERVRLYIAEIALAINHLHQMGYIYRDLKPRNVLLSEAGHTQLADMGLAAELTKDPDAKGVRRDGMPYYRRRKTIVGTPGYMAPELMVGKGKSRHQRHGYGISVDWWALGVTMYELLTGTKPFKSSQEAYSSAEARQNAEFAQLFTRVEFPPYTSHTAQDLCLGLLDPDQSTRYGCTEDGMDTIRTHPFFDGLDWDQLVQLQVAPTYVPRLKPISDRPKYPHYDAMMNSFDANEKSQSAFDWYASPQEEGKVYFEDWDWLAPNTLRLELGIARAMQEKFNPSPPQPEGSAGDAADEDMDGPRGSGAGGTGEEAAAAAAGATEEAAAAAAAADAAEGAPAGATAEPPAE